MWIWALCFLPAVSWAGESPESSIVLPYATEDGISEQGNFLDCTLFAMSRFLQLWASQRTGKRIPPLSPAFLAFGYNRVVGTHEDGSWELFTAAVVERYGILPRLVRPVRSDVWWPREDWQGLHSEWQPEALLDAVLDGKYRLAPAEVHPPNWEADGKTYLREVLRVHPRELSAYATMDIPFDENVEFSALRLKSEKATAEFLGADYSRARWKKLAPENAYGHILNALKKGNPTLATVFLEKLNFGLRDYAVVAPTDLASWGGNSSHAAVVVGRCFPSKALPAGSVNPAPCQGLSEDMDRRKSNECLLFQNSWGSSANYRGYFCLDRELVGKLMVRFLLPESPADATTPAEAATAGRQQEISLTSTANQTPTMGTLLSGALDALGITRRERLRQRSDLPAQQVKKIPERK